MTPADVLTSALLVVGALFFFAGTVGLLRFPDMFTRLHATTKADNLGLGLIVLGLSVQGPSLAVVVKMWLVWGLVLVASAVSAQLIAKHGLDGGVEPWRRG